MQIIPATRRRAPWLALLAAAVVTGCAATATPAAAPAPVATPVAGRWALGDSAFGALVTRLSEPAGFFSSENVVSNETSYLHVLDAMRRIPVQGGAYIGVGPDQNYSYIAAIRPSVAFMFDIRRDNLLEHLLFKAVFEMSANRVEYLANLLGKPIPADAASWESRSIADLVTWVESTATSPERVSATEAEIVRRVRASGIPVDDRDIQIVLMYRGAFLRDQLDVRYSSLDGRRMGNMPAWRDLLLQTDRAGAQLNYLAREELFQFVRTMHAENRIVPVTGDAAGARALRAVGDEIRARGETVSALYMSNVEQYLMRNGVYASFAENVKTLPRTEKTVIIRSVFNFGFGHPLFVPGHFSTSLMQYMDVFARDWDAGAIRDYNDVVLRGYIDP